jgi:hypothetical protein
MLANHGKPLATFTLELLPAAFRIVSQLAAAAPRDDCADKVVKSITGFPHALQLFNVSWTGRSVFGHKQLVLAVELIARSARVCGKDMHFSQALEIAFTAAERGNFSDGALYEAAITRGKAWLLKHAQITPAAADLWQGNANVARWAKQNLSRTLGSQVRKWLGNRVGGPVVRCLVMMTS